MTLTDLFNQLSYLMVPYAVKQSDHVLLRHKMEALHQNWQIKLGTNVLNTGWVVNHTAAQTQHSKQILEPWNGKRSIMKHVAFLARNPLRWQSAFALYSVKDWKLLIKTNYIIVTKMRPRVCIWKTYKMCQFCVFSPCQGLAQASGVQNHTC